MPDDAVLDRLRTESIAALGSYIETLPGARELHLFQVKSYEPRGFLLGWCVPYAFDDRIRDFHVLIGPSFPFEAPRIALVDRPDFLSWPHVESDGALCILQNNSNVSARDPIGVFQNLFARAVSLVEDCRTGANAIDFETEFNTYWHYKAADQGNGCRSLVSLSTSNRIINLWRGQKFDLIADDEATIKNWLARRYAKPQSNNMSDSVGRAGLIWISRALRPQEYPIGPVTC
jgi:hypothetical protein